MTNSQASSSSLKYGAAEYYGAKWQDWQRNAEPMSCPVLRTYLTLKMLKDFYRWSVSDDGNVYENNFCDDSSYENFDYEPTTFMFSPPPRIWSMVVELGLPTDRQYKTISITQQVEQLVYGGLKSEEDPETMIVNDYFLQIGPGVIFSLNSRRTNGPHWSQIALAAYRHYEKTDLRYVFRVDVINRVTVGVVRLIYEENETNWPDFNPSCWRYDTPEYRALLSTPNARGVAGLVIGGLEGTRYISYIITWADSKYKHLQMLFVIADC